MEKIKPPEDTYMIRCPRLGHQIYFSYCEKENNGNPCFKVLDCWYGHFDVEGYLRQVFGPQKVEELMSNPPKPKVLSLVELIEQAKRRKKETGK